MAKERLCTNCTYNNNGWCNKRKSNKGLRKVEITEREEIIKELKELDIRAIHEPNYENMTTDALQLRLKIFKSMFEEYFK